MHLSSKVAIIRIFMTSIRKAQIVDHLTGIDDISMNLFDD